MKIAIHSNQFCGRGTGKVPYDYGVALQRILNHEVVFITTRQSQNIGADQLLSQFQVLFYDKPPLPNQTYVENLETRDLLEKLVAKEKIDFLHMIKSGENDHITPSNCKTGIHCVFSMEQPHGSVYAGVSNWLAKKFNKKEFVPHIVRPYPPTHDLRKVLNIPKEAMVIGRHGGNDTFNVPFVIEALKNALAARKNLYFIFQSTTPFYNHERVFYLPWVSSHESSYNFIHACDAMLHARCDGETFGLAVAEFSVANKPIITWSGHGSPCYYSSSHLEILEDRAVVYNNQSELEYILLNIDKNIIQNQNWDKYSEKFSEAQVVAQYQKVFLGALSIMP